MQLAVYVLSGIYVAWMKFVAQYVYRIEDVDFTIMERRSEDATEEFRRMLSSTKTDAAQHYDILGPAWIEATAMYRVHLVEKLAEILSVNRTIETSLDLACGQSLIPIFMAWEGIIKGKVSGVDISKGMLERARTLATECGVNAEFLEGSLENLPVTENFDLVICIDGIQFCEDWEDAIDQASRKVRQGGLLVYVIQTEDTIPERPLSIVYYLKNLEGFALLAIEPVDNKRRALIVLERNGR